MEIQEDAMKEAAAAAEANKETAPDEVGGDIVTQEATEENPLIGTVEISWRGNIERTVFPLPVEVAFLSESSKLKFLDEVSITIFFVMLLHIRINMSRLV